MPGFGLSGVGRSTSVVYSTSVSALRSSDSPVPPSSTRFPSSSLSSTSNSAAALNTFSRPLLTSRSAQTTTSSASSSSTSSVGHVDSYSISSSVTSTASATTPFAIVTKEPPPAEPTSTGVSTSTSTPTPVSSTISSTTTGTESISTSAHLVTKSPDPPQQIVSASIPIDIQTTQPGSTFLATITSWSLVPISTSRGNGSPNSSSTSNSLLSLILGPVLGVLVILVLGMVVFKWRARRRAENMSNVLSSGSETSPAQEDRMMIEGTPRVNAVAVGRRITSHRGSSTYTPEHIITPLHAGESSQNSNGQSSDPFVDKLEIVPSRTGLHAASTHSVDGVSTNVAFTIPVNVIARDVGEFGSSIDASTSSLGLHFVAPLTTDDSSTRSPHLSPSWHYAPTSSPRKREHWNEEQQGETSPVSLQAPASPKPFPLGMGNARLRLHALLEEARKI